MTTVREPKTDPQARAVEIIADAIRILKTRDGIDVPETLILERARNTVAALEGTFGPFNPTDDGESRPARRLRSFGSPPPTLSPGSRFAAPMAEYLALRAELDEADRQLSESFEKLEGAVRS
jgi:hypothetical protein